MVVVRDVKWHVPVDREAGVVSEAIYKVACLTRWERYHGYDTIAFSSSMRMAMQIEFRRNAGDSSMISHESALSFEGGLLSDIEPEVWSPQLGLDGIMVSVQG